MPAIRCRNCGANSFRADRALAGRLVCNQCGIPYGNKVSPKNKFIRRGINTNIIYLMLAVLIIILVFK